MTYCINLLKAHTRDLAQSTQMDWGDVIKLCIIRTEMSCISVAGVNNAETDSALQKRKLDWSYQEDAPKIVLNHPSLLLCPVTSPMHGILDHESHSSIPITVCRAFYFLYHYRKNCTFLLLKIHPLLNTPDRWKIWSSHIMIIPEDALVSKGYLLIHFSFPSRNIYPKDLCESLMYVQSFFF